MTHNIIDDFFAAYEQNFNAAMNEITPNIKKSVAASFAGCLVESSPSGVMCGENGKELLSKIEQGFEFYKKIGSKSMRIHSKEITILDQYHTMVKVHWHYVAAIKQKPDVHIGFDIFYFLTTAVDNTPRIFAYIAGDEQKALKEAGLMPKE